MKTQQFIKKLLSEDIVTDVLLSLTILLIVFKFMWIITWSWWWVFSPLEFLVASILFDLLISLFPNFLGKK